MAQAGYTPISLYYSTTAAAVPTAGNLVAGELAINIVDGKLYYENNSGTVTLLASAAGASGDVVGPASATDNALARFDATTGKLIQNSVGILSDAGILTGLTGITSSGSITFSSLTSGRVTYAGTAGLLQDSANLTFNGTTLTANTLNLTNALGTAYGGTGLTSFTSGGVVYASSSSALATGSALVFDGTNLGIGASTPADALNVGTAKKFRATHSAFVYQQIFSSASGNFYNAIGDNFQLTADVGAIYLTTTASQPMVFQTSNTDRVTINGAGNVGIGTSSPSTKLDVRSAIGTSVDNPQNILAIDTTSFAAGNGGGVSFGFVFNTAGNAITRATAIKGIKENSTDGNYASALTFSTTANSASTAERMRLDSSGNLGLGVTPSAWVAYKALQVGSTGGALSSSSSSDFEITTNAYYSSGWLSQGAGVASSRYRLLSGTHAWFNAPSGTAGNAISFTQALTLDANGKLLLGSTAANSSHMMKITNSTQAGIVLTGANSVGNDASITVDVANGSILMVSENIAGDGALFFCGYASSTITLLSDPNNRYATSITAGKICVTKSAGTGTVTITNKLGSTKNITAGKFSTSD